MKIAVLILAHKNPGQVERLARSLQHPSIKVFVHADKKSSLPGFSFSPGVEIVRNNVPVYWGDFSPVQATLNGMLQIQNSGYDFDYFILLSGQDYPIKPIPQLLRFLDENKGRQFIAHHPVNEQGWKAAMGRYQYYHYRRNKNVMAWGVFAFLRGAMKILGIKRKPPIPIWAGSQWFNISREVFIYILDYIEQHPEYMRFMKRSNFTDELFFQTIIANSPFKDQCIDQTLRYIDWNEKEVKKVRSPKILTMADWPKLQQSDAFFARKFNDAVDKKILDTIDTSLLQ